MTNRTTQRETVVGVFDSQDAAQQAIQQLKDAGFSPDDIGILMQDKQGAQDLAASTGTKAGEDAGKGAVTGGVLGGLAGLLVGIGALAIPGIGPVLAAGPLAAALGTAAGATATGAAIGAGAGAIVGALVGMGVPKEEAQVYEQRFNQGRILLTVRSGANRYDEAQQILRNAGAEDIQFGGAQAGTTQGYTQGQSYAQGQTGYTQGQTGYAQTQTGYTQGQANYTQGQELGNESLRVPVVEETLTANKGVRQAGEVEVRKNVREEQVNIPVEVSHEEVTVTRHAVDRPVQPGEQVLEDGQVIRVPIREETVDVQKQAHVTGEVEIGKQKVSEQRQVSDTVRREEVDVQPVGNVEARGNQGQVTSQETDSTYTEDGDYNQNTGSRYNQ